MTEDGFETMTERSGKLVPISQSGPVSSKTANDSSAYNATTVATTPVTTAPTQIISESEIDTLTSVTSKPVTSPPATAVATTTSKSGTTSQKIESQSESGAKNDAVAISVSKQKFEVTPVSPTATSSVPTTVAKPSHDVAKTDSPSNDALVSTNIERSTTTLTETSTVTSTSTQWTRTQSPQGTIRYRENTDVRVQSAVDKKTITKEKSTLAIKASENSANEKPESKNSANEKPESKSSANEKPVSKSTHGSAVITAGVGLTLVPVDDSSSEAPQTKNSEISDKENEIPNDQIVKSDGEETETEKTGSEETGRENDHTGNALEVILMTDDGNKKPEKSWKSETSEKKSNQKPKKKQKKPLNAVKSPKMSEKDSKLVKKYNREYFGLPMVQIGSST